MSLFIDSATLLVSGYVEVTKLPIHLFVQNRVVCSTGHLCGAVKSVEVFTKLTHPNEATSEMRKIQIKLVKIKSHLPAQRLILIQTVHPAQLYAFSTHSSSGYGKTLIQRSNFRSFYLFLFILSWALKTQHPVKLDTAECVFVSSDLYYAHFGGLLLYNIFLQS